VKKAALYSAASTIQTEFASVLEWSRPPVSIICCCARSSALDALAPEGDVLVARVAPDELLLVMLSKEADEFQAQVSTELKGLDPAAIVVDHSDAFDVTMLSGPIRDAACRLSAIDFGDQGLVQGLVADVPCKAMIVGDRLYLLAPSTYAHHVRGRIREACRDLPICEADPDDVISLIPTATG
jgi:hypothetical protein